MKEALLILTTEIFKTQESGVIKGLSVTNRMSLLCLLLISTVRGGASAIFVHGFENWVML